MSINNININRNKIAFAGQQQKNKGNKAGGLLAGGVIAAAGTGIGAGVNRAMFNADKAADIYTGKLTEDLKDLMKDNNLNKLEIVNGKVKGDADKLKDECKKGFDKVVKCFTNLEATFENDAFKIAEKQVNKFAEGKVTPAAETASQSILTLSPFGREQAKSFHANGLLKTGAFYGAGIGLLLGIGAAIKIACKRKKDTTENVPLQAISMK